MSEAAEELRQARDWLRVTFGLDVDEDDQILIVTAAALEAARRAEARFDDVAAAAVEKAQEPLRDAMTRQVELLRAITDDFRAAGDETRQLADHRAAIAGAARDLGHDMKALHGDLVEIRALIKDARTAAPSPVLPLLAGAAIFVVGIAVGLFVGGALR